MLKLYQKIFEEFREVKGRGRIAVFGSVVRGESRFDSDIDVAVITNDENFLSKVEEIADKILFKYRKVVSITRLSEKEFENSIEPIVKEIREGIMIHEGSWGKKISGEEIKSSEERLEAAELLSKIRKLLTQ